jgi:hypothetical protein
MKDWRCGLSVRKQNKSRAKISFADQSSKLISVIHTFSEYFCTLRKRKYVKVNALIIVQNSLSHTWLVSLFYNVKPADTPWAYDNSLRENYDLSSAQSHKLYQELEFTK